MLHRRSCCGWGVSHVQCSGEGQMLSLSPSEVSASCHNSVLPFTGPSGVRYQGYLSLRDSGMLTCPQHAHKTCVIQYLTPNLSSLFCYWPQTPSLRCLVLPCPWNSHHLFAQEEQKAANTGVPEHRSAEDRVPRISPEHWSAKGEMRQLQVQ